jgi:hypothetical protein
LLNLILNVLTLGKISNIKITTPIPPRKWVDERQNSNPLGRLSISVRIVAPVVVYPDTLSYHALIRENSPPHNTYGNIPNTHERTHENTIIVNPSLILISSYLRTKIRGNKPVVKVITALRNNGENAGSKSYIMEVIAPKNMKTALKTRAIPIFLETTLIFIAC